MTSMITMLLGDLHKAHESVSFILKS